MSAIFDVVKNRLDAYNELHSTIDKSITFVRAALNFSEVKINGKDIQDYFEN